MTSLCRRVFPVLRRSILYTSVRNEISFPDPMEHISGLEKREKLAILAGDDDPFDLKAGKRGPGTKECPNIVYSFFESRIVGCVCQEENTYVIWMWLHEGMPRRCECGHWFKLVRKDPL